MAADRTSFSAQVNSMTLGDKQNETPDDSSELVYLVDDLLNNLSKKFDGVSNEILAKMDEMSRRIDSLEANIMAGNVKDDGASKDGN
jgi:heat shock factor-binding protein 1